MFTCTARTYSFSAYRQLTCESFCLALIILLCMPVLMKSDGHGQQQEERWEFLCTADGQSVALQSYLRDNRSTAPTGHEALGKKIWTLRIDGELWHGELMDIHYGGSTNRATTFEAFMLAFPTVPSRHNETRWNQVQMLSNKRRPIQVLASPATGRASYGGKGMLVVECNPKQPSGKSTHHNHTYRERCLMAPHSLISITGNDMFGTIVLLHTSEGAFAPLFFHPLDQCPWINQPIARRQRRDEISAQMTPQEYGRSAGLALFDDNKAIQTLQLSFNSSLLPSFISPRTLRDRIDGLFDDRSARFACNRGITKEFMATSMINSTLQIYSSVIKGLNGGSHGFEVSPLHDFNLAPGQSAKLLISYQPDFKARISEGILHLVTSTGVLSMTIKADVSIDILEFCQNVALIARAKSFVLQACSMALFLVLLVFGKMLKQEVKNASADGSQRPCKSETAKLTSTSRSMVDGDAEKSATYVSINVGIARGDKSKNSGSFWNPRKAIELLSAAVGCMVWFKVPSISQASTIKESASSSIKKKPDNPTSLTNGSVGKKKNPTHPRGCNQPTAITNPSHGNSPLRSTAYLYKKGGAIPRLKIPRPSEVMEPESATATLSDKEREKVKQKRKKRGTSLLASGMENEINSGCSSPLSMPSSPVTRAASVSPVSSRSKTISLQEHGRTKNRDVSQWHSSRDSRLQFSDGKSSESSCFKDLSDAQTKVTDEPKAATQVPSSEERLITRANGATLTASHTFPAAGQRFSEEGLQSRQADGRKSSNSNLVSTSSVASHARAPGSPLSSTSQSFPNNLLSCNSSPLTGRPFSSTSLPFSGSPFSSLPSFPGSPLLSSSIPLSDNPLSSTSTNLNEAAHGYCQNMWQFTTSPFCGCSSSSSGKRWRKGEPFWPQQMHGWNGSRSSKRKPYSRHGVNNANRNVNDETQGPKDVVLYDMWGDHLAELNRRWQSSWLRKDAPFRRTRPPSSLPPLLKTPAFSIFSSNDPFPV